MPLHIFLFGPPGSGKSTQGVLLSAKRGIPHLSIGELLRLKVQEDSTEGRAIAAKMEKGAMVDDDIIWAMLRSHLAQPKMSKGFILDGFPRTEDQLPMLETLVEELHLGGYLPVDINIPQEESYERLMQRGRKDDTAEVILRRLDAYAEMAGPILRYFKERESLIVVDGHGTVEEVAQRLDTALSEHLSQKKSPRTRFT